LLKNGKLYIINYINYYFSTYTIRKIHSNIKDMLYINYNTNSCIFLTLDNNIVLYNNETNEEVTNFTDQIPFSLDKKLFDISCNHSVICILRLE